MVYDSARAKLIEQLSTEISDRRVLEVMSRVPRELFIPPENMHRAYEDNALPIGYEQTISQPLIVAMMTEALELSGAEKVLEIGTGSGYQTAILAELAREVISTERVPALARQAKRLLYKLGHKNVEVHLALKCLGFVDKAPYDAIIATAGAPQIPEDLLAQLAVGGKMVIPVGSRYIQDLCKITKLKDRNIVQNLGGCRFVSLIGKGAWEDEE